MNYKLKDINGKVNFLLKAGKDLVSNQMTITGANGIISKGAEIKKSEIEGYPIGVDDKWFFEGVIVSEQESDAEITVDEEETEGE